MEHVHDWSNVYLQKLFYIKFWLGFLQKVIQNIHTILEGIYR